MKRRIRIAANLASYGEPQDTLTNQAIVAWRGGALEIDLAFFRRAGNPPATTLITDAAALAELESVHLTLKPAVDNKAPTAETVASAGASTVEINDSLTAEEWTYLEGQHVRLELSTAQMAIAAGDYWLTIWGLRTDGERTPLVAGKLTLREASISEPGEPEPGTVWLTVGEADARYARAGGLNGILIEGDGVDVPDPDVRGFYAYDGEHEGRPSYAATIGGETYIIRWVPDHPVVGGGQYELTGGAGPSEWVGEDGTIDGIYQVVSGASANVAASLVAIDQVTGAHAAAAEASAIAANVVEFGVAASDEFTPLTVGTGKVTFRLGLALTLSDVRASLTTAATGSAVEVDVKADGVSIFSTLLTIDSGDKTSVGAATPAVISAGALAADTEMTVDISQIGSGDAGTGLKLWFKGDRVL